MKKLILILLICLINSQSISPAFAKKNTKNHKEEYIRLNKSYFEELKRNALISRSLLQRIRDLETLYRNVEAIIKTINSSIQFLQKFLNIDEIDLLDIESENEFEHISGVIMSPGYVEFSAITTDPLANFDEILGDSFLEMDIYYNKNLFTIDHIEGDHVLGNEYRKVSLSTKTSGAKDRIKLPLSDLLVNELSFKVYLAPRNPKLIKVGDKTKLDIRYFKRIKANENGEKIAPIEYGFKEGSAEEIEVVVK